MTALVVLPPLVPLLAGALLLLAGRNSRTWPVLVSAAAVFAQLLAAVALGMATSDGTVLAYLAGNWAAPFGIALAADRLAAILLSLTKSHPPGSPHAKYRRSGSKRDPHTTRLGISGKPGTLRSAECLCVE